LSQKEHVDSHVQALELRATVLLQNRSKVKAPNWSRRRKRGHEEVIFYGDPALVNAHFDVL
jgi:hypothetical protein